MSARFSRRSSLTLVGTVALVIAVANPAAAPPGDLDTTFDGDGRVTTDVAASTDQGFAVALQADGKIVAAGVAVVSAMEDFALARYNSNGSLDPTFDGDGLVTTDFGGNLDQVLGVAVQADGKIVAAGRADVSGPFDFALARYNTDGSLDTGFDGDGKVTTDVAASVNDQAFEVAIQGDGKIVAAGVADVSGNNDFAVARYNTDGSLDTGFDGDGKVTTNFASGSFDQVHGLAIQGDGKIVAAGLASSGDAQFALARYNTDGSPDATFDTDGKVTTDFAGDFDQAFGLAIQGDGKIVAAGASIFSGTVDFGLARYNTDGSLDITFSSDGKVTTDFAGMDDVVFAVAIQANGRIVAAGRVNNSGNYDFGLARYTCLRRTSRPTSIPFCP